MKCTKCGKNIADDSNFCEFCGARIKKKRDKIKQYILLTIGILLLFVSVVLGEIYLGTGLLGGLIFSPVFFYIIKYAAKYDTTQTTIVTTTMLKSPVAKRIPLESLRLVPIILSPDSGFIYKAMKETVSRYIPKDPNTLITVGYDKLGGSSVTDRAVMQFYRDSDSAELDIAIYFWPPSHAMLERFERNPFFSDFKEVANDKTYNAYYGKDIDKAVKVASYILATVYYIPMDTQLEFDCDYW